MDYSLDGSNPEDFDENMDLMNQWTGDWNCDTHIYYDDLTKDNTFTSKTAEGYTDFLHNNLFISEIESTIYICIIKHIELYIYVVMLILVVLVLRNIEGITYFECVC